MRQRHGFSLVIVLVFVVALLLVGASFSTAILHATRASRLGWQGDQSARAADVALLTSLNSWDRADAAALRTGETDTVHLATASTGQSQVTRTRLNARTYLLVATAQRRDGAMRATRREVGQVARLEWPLVPAQAAITTLGSVTVGDSATVLGTDGEPAGWADECANDHAAAPLDAIVAPFAVIGPAAIVAGRASGTGVRAPLDVAVLTQQIEAAIAAVSAAATQRTTDSVIDLDARAPVASVASGCSAWLGDARRGAAVAEACQRRWPVLHAAHPGITRLTGRTPVQGVLVLEGDLHVDQGVQVSGLVLVRGALRTTTAVPPALPVRPAAPAAQLVGAIVVRDQAGAGSRLEAPILVQASRCGVRLALAALGQPTPTRQHGWSARP